jgi:hypothetical protein
MAERIFYDGVDAKKLPRDAAGVCGYVDGNYAWSKSDWALFPNAVKVRIAVFADTNDGHVLDVEPGNATPAESVDWVLMRRKAGVDPTVYMNTSTWKEVIAAFRNRKVAEPHYWVAQYDNVKIVPAGAIAKQYYNNNALGFDLSVVPGIWPGVEPVPQPPVTPFEEDFPMQLIGSVQEDPANPGVNQGIWYYDLENLMAMHLATPVDVQTVQKAGSLAQGDISFAQHQKWLAVMKVVSK